MRLYKKSYTRTNLQTVLAQWPENKRPCAGFFNGAVPPVKGVYDLAEWCCLAELGTLSMDNNCAAVTFPDFTRGHWDVQKGYKHAYAAPEVEAATEAEAEAYSAAQKSVTVQKNLWALYDAVKAAKAAGDAKAEAKAQMKLDTAKAAAKKAIAKELAKAKK